MKIASEKHFSFSSKESSGGAPAKSKRGRKGVVKCWRKVSAETVRSHYVNRVGRVDGQTP